MILSTKDGHPFFTTTDMLWVYSLATSICCHYLLTFSRELSGMLRTCLLIKILLQRYRLLLRCLDTPSASCFSSTLCMSSLPSNSVRVFSSETQQERSFMVVTWTFSCGIFYPNSLSIFNTSKDLIVFTVLIQSSEVCLLSQAFDMELLQLTLIPERLRDSTRI
jgi:hypothetical protein